MENGKPLPFVPGSQANGGGIANNKWDENRQPEPRWEKQRQSGINNPFVRMSDVILMLAEVKAELGDEVTAKQYLSEVHNECIGNLNLLTLMDLYLNGEVLKKLFSKNVSLNLVVKVFAVMT